MRNWRRRDSNGLGSRCSEGPQACGSQRLTRRAQKEEWEGKLKGDERSTAVVGPNTPRHCLPNASSAALTVEWISASLLIWTSKEQADTTSAPTKVEGTVPTQVNPHR